MTETSVYAGVKMAVTLKFSGSLSQSDPQVNGVLIVGQTKHLAQVNYDDIKVKFGTHVDREVRKVNSIFLWFHLRLRYVKK